MNHIKKECVAMLLAGGQGSRLYALTQEMAKPPKIWMADVLTAAQKSPVRASSVSRSRAERGEASSRCPAG